MALPIFDFLLGQKNKNSASKAKDRLQIILAHERSNKMGRTPDYLPKMREEILDVIKKYVEVDDDQLEIKIDEDNGFEVLELNLVLPDDKSKR